MSSVQPVVSEASIGADAWRKLHEDARDAGRTPRSQALTWLRFAAKLRLEGRNLELSPAQLARLLGRLESVA